MLRYLNYLTFDQFAEKHRISEELVEQIRNSSSQSLSLLIEEKNIETVKKKIEQGKELKDEDIISILLYWHRIMGRKEERSEDICEWVKTRCNLESEDVGDEKLLRIMFAQSFHEIYYGWQNQNTVNPEEVTPILVNKDLPKEPTLINLVIPIVPVISVFSTYIIALLNEIIKCYHELPLTIEYFWNIVTYEKMKKEFLSKHLAYKKGLDFKKYSHISESKFMSFVNLLLLNCDWIDRWDGKPITFSKMNILRETNVMDEEQLENQLRREIYDTMLHRRMRKVSFHNKLVVGGLKDYMGVAKETERELISLYAEEIVRRKQSSKGLLFLIGRLPDLVLLWDILNEEEKKDVYLLAYLPFPFEREIRVKWPFYVTWYSPYVYNIRAKNKGSKDSLVVLREEYMRKLIISILKRLKLNFLNSTKLDAYKYYEILQIVTDDVFKKIDEMIDQQLQYIF